MVKVHMQKRSKNYKQNLQWGKTHRCLQWPSLYSILCWSGVCLPNYVGLYTHTYVCKCMEGFPGVSDTKESACSEGDWSLIPGSGSSPAEGNSYPLQYPCLENSMDRGAWWLQSMGLQGVRHTDTNTLTFHFTMHGWQILNCIDNSIRLKNTIIWSQTSPWLIF